MVDKRQWKHVLENTLISCIFIVASVLFYYAYCSDSPQAYTISGRGSSAQPGVGVPSFNAVGKSEHGRIPFNIIGNIDISRYLPGDITLEMGSLREANCCVVNLGTYTGNSQLKAASSSVRYRLIDTDRSTTLAYGIITIQAQSIADGSQFAQKLATYLALLATLMAPGQWILDSMDRRNRMKLKMAEDE